MVFFCSDLIGHNNEIKDTFLARLAKYMGDVWEKKSHFTCLNNVGGSKRGGEEAKTYRVPTKCQEDYINYLTTIPKNVLTDSLIPWFSWLLNF